MGGLQIRVSVINPNASGLPLLLFNGIGASIELLLPFVDHLVNTTVIIYDAPGAGKSETPLLPWRPRQHAKLASQLVTKLGYSQVNVMGISWGGMIAQQFARQYPDICQRLILAATSAGQIMIPGSPSVLFRMSNPLRYLRPEYMQSIAGHIYGGSLRTNKLRAREHSRLMKPPTVRGYYYQLFSLVGWSSLLWLHKLKQPTLIMAGNDDPIIPLINARVLVGLIPNSTLRVVDCGHLFVLTRAAKLAPEIEHFLN